jgi:hypothetical protein
MKKIKLGLAKMTIPEKIQKIRTIVTKMTGNTNFTTPIPSLNTVTAAINKLEISFEAALDGGRTKKAAVNLDEVALDTTITQLAAYVQDISLGDETKILSSGMEIKAKPIAPQDMIAPVNVRLLTKPAEGEITLKWKPINNAKSYIIQSTATPHMATSWEAFAVSGKASYKATELISNTVLWFRIAAVGAKGVGIFGDPIRASIL